jgi:hypothetical protein
VFVLNVVDGCMPSDLGAGTSAEIEEERNLAAPGQHRKHRSAGTPGAVRVRAGERIVLHSATRVPEDLSAL